MAQAVITPTSETPGLQHHICLDVSCKYLEHKYTVTMKTLTQIPKQCTFLH